MVRRITVRIVTGRIVTVGIVTVGIITVRIVAVKSPGLVYSTVGLLESGECRPGLRGADVRRIDRGRRCGHFRSDLVRAFLSRYGI